MSLPIIGDIISKALDVIDELVPDKDKAQDIKSMLELKILEASKEINISQTVVNTEEAKSSNLFISGWRPMVGWICATSLMYTYILSPLMVFFARLVIRDFTMPTMDSASLITLLIGMLGLSGLRTYEKINNSEGNRS